jgi:hypothetical protein
VTWAGTKAMGFQDDLRGMLGRRFISRGEQSKSKQRFSFFLICRHCEGIDLEWCGVASLGKAGLEGRAGELDAR